MTEVTEVTVTEIVAHMMSQMEDDLVAKAAETLNFIERNILMGQDPTGEWRGPQNINIYASGNSFQILIEHAKGIDGHDYYRLTNEGIRVYKQLNTVK